MGVVHVLLNPTASGRRRRQREGDLREALTSRRQEVVEIVPPSVDRIAPAIEKAASEGMSRLIIAGGDGVIHHALPAVAETDVIVGIVPIGTGNDFARALGLHSDIDTAVAAALGDWTPIDLIAADPPTDHPPATVGPESSLSRRWAASVITGGFSGKVNARANGLRFPPGQQRYTVATLLELPRLDSFELTLDLDGSVEELESSLFAIANTRFFGGGMAICPEAVPDDGLLDVTVIGPTSPFTLARVLPMVFSGRHVRHPSVTTYRAERIGVSAACEMWADGERFVKGPFMVAPGALRVAGSLKGPRRGQT